MLPIIKINAFGPDHPFTVSRRKFIEDTLAAGKAARFHYEAGFYKDVKEWKPNYEAGETDRFDLECFRQSGGRVPYVAWDSPDLSVEAVEI